MTLQDLGSLGEVVGATATVATLIYLAIQIRANPNAVRSAAAQTVHEALATWYRTLAADADLSQLVTNGLRELPSLSETEKARFVATFMAFLSCSQDAFIKWREGSLSPALVGLGARHHGHVPRPAAAILGRTGLPVLERRSITSRTTSCSGRRTPAHDRWSLLAREDLVSRAATSR
jgi:hypothetical protein